MASRIITAYDDRIRRAQQLVAQGAVHKQGDGSFVVRSQSGDGEYLVTLEYAHDPTALLNHGHCTCPDWQKMAEAINEWPLCLASARSATSPYEGICWW